MLYFIFALIFCGVLLSIIIYFFADSIFRHYFPKTSKYDQYKGTNTEMVQTDLTVIYYAKGSVEAIIGQIQALIELITETYKDDETFTFQIAIFHRFSNYIENSYELIKPFRNDNRLAWFYMEEDPFQNFVAGCAKAKGKVIVSADYIAAEIGSVKNREPEFIDFQERKVEKIFREPNKLKYLMPIAISKLTAERILPHVPFVSYGYSLSIHNMAVSAKIPIIIRSAKYEPTVTSLYEIFLTEFFTAILPK